MPDLATLVAATPWPGRAALVAVDGVDASGKTTFAGELAAAYVHHGRTARIVHLDDFLNPREVRYRRGRFSPEGFFLDSYDLAAFTSAVLDPRPGPRPEPGTVVIVEGLFLHRDELCDRWDLSVFLDVPAEVSVRRMAPRDGTSADPDDPQVARYVQGQRLYLTRCRPRERATYVIDNS